MNLELHGRKVLVTGGSKGIGLAIAHAFAREGAQPTLVSRSAEGLAKAAADVQQATGIEPRVLALDLSVSDNLAALVEQAGDIDILVNNAGAIPAGSLDKIDDATWRRAWDLKLFGYIDLIRRVLPRMEERGSGIIANIIGMAGAAPRADYICGATANAALMAFTQAIGGHSPAQGVRVFGINPSATRSERMETMMRVRAASTFGDENRWAEFTAKMPFGRAIEPKEIADLTVFACSPLAGYVSGTVINVDGGQMFR
ncbi:MAG: SDR family oxidoreductase [Gammaproteobacteria bacterium]|nr:SDR family oxidoreductase [Gammaproteobacteria bacterium]